MSTTHIFLCHNVAQTEQRDSQVLDQLDRKLQDTGAKIIEYPGSPAEESFLTFFQEQLPSCQWFILFQTPAIVSLPAVQQAVITVLKVVEQQRMQGIMRFIATPSEPHEVPPAWSIIPTVDATYDFARALEKLLLRLSSARPATEAATTSSAPMSRPGNVLVAPVSAPRLSNALTSAPFTPHPDNAYASSNYDRPPVPPSRLVKFRKAVRSGYQDMLYEHKRLGVVLSLLILLALLGTGLGFLLRPGPAAHSRPKPVVQIPVYGEVYFSSTNPDALGAAPHTLDHIDVYLENLKSPASGNSYYGWLLPDEANSIEGPTVAVGQFTPDNGSAHLTYESPDQSNLLATVGRFLITEEPTSPQPQNPTPDQSEWRYYGSIPQTPNPNDSNRFSALDHLRHLLVSGPITMTAMAGPLPGGLGFWLSQKVLEIFEQAVAASNNDAQASVSVTRADVTCVLDLLDGTDYVGLDAPKGTPLVCNSVKPLLTLDPNAMIPGYIHDIESHLLGYSSSPGVTKDQQALAGNIDAELNQVDGILEQVRDDAKQLVAMSDQDLLRSSSIPLLDDLTSQAASAYVGQLNATTGSRRGGAISIFDQLQQLARFSVIAYTGQA